MKIKSGSTFLDVYNLDIAELQKKVVHLFERVTALNKTIDDYRRGNLNLVLENDELKHQVNVQKKLIEQLNNMISEYEYLP